MPRGGEGGYIADNVGGGSWPFYFGVPGFVVSGMGVGAFWQEASTKQTPEHFFPITTVQGGGSNFGVSLILAFDAYRPQTRWSLRACSTAAGCGTH